MVLAVFVCVEIIPFMSQKLPFIFPETKDTREISPVN